MLKFGHEPFLECSSKGDYRFSAFKARLKQYNNKSIEELYQAAKIFDGNITNQGWRYAKGKKPLNAEFCRQFYSYLWTVWFIENPKAVGYVRKFNGTSDIFGQEGRACQAEEIYKICIAGT